MARIVDLPRGTTDSGRSEADRRGLTEPDCVIIFDERGRIQHFSPEAERLFGYPGEAVRDLNAGLLTPCFDRDRPDGEIQIVMAQRRDGGTVPVALAIAEMAGAGERLFIGAIRDLTLIVARDRQRQKLEAELRRTAQFGELDHLTSKLANRVTSRLTATQARDRAAVRLAIGEHTAEVIGKLRSIAKPAIAEPRVESLIDIIEVASGLALAGVRQPPTIRQPMTIKIRVATDAAEAVIDRNLFQRILRATIRDALRATTASARREITIATGRVGEMVEVRIADTTSGLTEDNRAEDEAEESVLFRVALPRPVAWSAEQGGRHSRA